MNTELVQRLLVTFTLLFTSASALAADYSLTIQPILPEKELKENYQPLADYLSEQTGHSITIDTHRSFVFYWHKMRKAEEGFDLVLDAAHFTDYRVKNLGFTVLAKLPDTVSFSIVTREDDFILDTDELMSKRIATLPSPSLGALRLEKLFPNPMRIPHYEWVLNSEVAAEGVIDGDYDAAIIPTRLVSTYSGLNTVLTTEPVPHMAVSASAAVPAEVADAVRDALIRAKDTEKGRQMLQALKLNQFEAASNETYDGYASLLNGVFGY